MINQVKKWYLPPLTLSLCFGFGFRAAGPPFQSWDFDLTRNNTNLILQRSFVLLARGVFFHELCFSFRFFECASLGVSQLQVNSNSSHFLFVRILPGRKETNSFGLGVFVRACSRAFYGERRVPRFFSEHNFFTKFLEWREICALLRPARNFRVKHVLWKEIETRTTKSGGL